MTVLANAQPAKRLFISLLTRDISLVDALLDILDNSINAAMEPYAEALLDAEGYHQLLSNPEVKPTATIKVSISAKGVTIDDDAGGISLADAETRVFAFGRADAPEETNDRLSVYGIGLKRAIFKLGNRISIRSNHPDVGFSVDLNVEEWQSKGESPWRIPIEPVEYDVNSPTGTSISVTELYPDVVRRISDGTFIDEVKYRVSRTYAYFLSRIIDLYVNEVLVPPTEFLIGSNFTNSLHKIGRVSYSITAGIAAPVGSRFLQETAGWFVFCNGRTVVYADKTLLTGWGSLLPVFQPKHRPFIGLVFFVSAQPEELPWTTTKASVNQESLVWQDARRNMATVARNIISFLDRRYTDEGTEIPAEELAEASGANVNVLTASVSNAAAFRAPRAKPPEEVTIQYPAKVSQVERIKSYLGKAMSAREVGRYTFDYFLKNQVDR
jgi:hypothetical protein